MPVYLFWISGNIPTKAVCHQTVYQEIFLPKQSVIRLYISGNIPTKAVCHQTIYQEIFLPKQSVIRLYISGNIPTKAVCHQTVYIRKYSYQSSLLSDCIYQEIFLPKQSVIRLYISGNIPTKAVCPLMRFLFEYSENCSYPFGRMDRVGWRLAHGEDGRGWSTLSQEVPHCSCKMSVRVHHLITSQPLSVRRCVIGIASWFDHGWVEQGWVKRAQRRLWFQEISGAHPVFIKWLWCFSQMESGHENDRQF